ncbi:hypothetical protein G6F22_019087 [Rhizopus arrhizus]|nr:hypothetical protein G6F22_019087 [Rhizopus arrhizus]
MPGSGGAWRAGAPAAGAAGGRPHRAATPVAGRPQGQPPAARARRLMPATRPCGRAGRLSGPSSSCPSAGCGRTGARSAGPGPCRCPGSSRLPSGSRCRCRRTRRNSSPRYGPGGSRAGWRCSPSAGRGTGRGWTGCPAAR